jgi:hypothetical protein
LERATNYDQQEQLMHSLRLGQNLVIAVALSLMLLIAGVVGLGVGIRQGAVVPLDLNVSLSGFRIVAYTTDPIECRPHGLCPGATRYYDVVWVVRETAPDYVHDIWHRILTVPLQR